MMIMIRAVMRAIGSKLSGIENMVFGWWIGGLIGDLGFFLMLEDCERTKYGFGWGMLPFLCLASMGRVCLEV
jgi:hypothetical protein